MRTNPVAPVCQTLRMFGMKPFSKCVKIPWRALAAISLIKAHFNQRPEPLEVRRIVLLRIPRRKQLQRLLNHLRRVGIVATAHALLDDLLCLG